MFQSSPALTGGCSQGSGTPTKGVKRFNPHPPLRADALSTLHLADPFAYVSILTRPYGRMLSAKSSLSSKSLKVSILTRPYGRML